MISKKTQVLKSLPWALATFVAFGYLGKLMDNHENERMTKFRDKSALFGRELKPGERPSWP